jgi:branched-chain amino acid transport system permease protein
LGTVIAGVLLGLSEVLAQAYLEPQLGEFGHNIHTVSPYIIMILVLMVRPYGLFGQKEVERL